MKIRTRLTLVFSILIIIILIVFGWITYKTFSESIAKNKNQVYAYKIRDSFSKINTGISNSIFDIKALSSEFNDVNLIALNEIESSKILRHFNEHLEANKLLSSIYIVDPEGNEVLRADRELSSKSAKENKKILINISKKNASEHFIFKEARGISIAYPFFAKAPQNHFYLLVYKISAEKLRRIALSSIKDEEALLITSKDGVLLLDTRDSKKKQFEYLSIKDILSNIKKHDNSKLIPLEYGNTYVFSSSFIPAGLNLIYAVPKTAYLSDLIILKNRIIVAMVITIWISMWVVLIIAYRLSMPIMFLSKAAKDITVLDYENPIAIPRTKDEIEDLARSFESMRLRIKDLVLKDALTDVYNRRYLIQFLEREISRADRMGNHLSVLMIDIDHFKSINDTYGHFYGDKVLQEVARALTEIVREYDIVSRYGGEEFVVVLPNIGSREAYLSAERIRKVIELDKMLGDDGVNITISIGLSSYEKDTCNTPEKLINTADIALYEAKRTGRNRTITYKVQKAV